MGLSLRILAVAAAVMAFAVPGTISAQEYIVSSQIVSDEAVGGGVVSGDVGVAGHVQATGARTYGHPHLFYNYYTQGYSNAVNAQMYLSPVPVPPNVGHTFMTYQPLQPEHYMYRHTDRYHNHYDAGRGLNRTRVRYSVPPVKAAVDRVYWNLLRIPR